MKGVVFTEFLELVEDKFGYEMVDNIINDSVLPSGGAYTAIGTYPHSEMVELVTNLSKHTKVEVSDLLKLYGKHLFGVFVKGYGFFFKDVTCSFQLFESIEHYIHVEVLKLYPDAELPRFSTKRLQDNVLEMIYTSERRMGDFAEGLIEAGMEHYQEDGHIKKEYLEESGKVVRFLITKTN